MGIGQDMAPTACPGSDMAHIVPVSSGWDTAEECMEPTSGTVRPFVSAHVAHRCSPFNFRNILWATRRNSDVEPGRNCSAKERVLLRVIASVWLCAGHFRSTLDPGHVAAPQ